MEQKIRVLIVEDQESIANVIKAYLEKEKFEAIIALSGKEALELIENQNIDFAILDLMLPDLSGEEVCKKLRERSSVPILMLTAKVTDEDKIYGLNIGADDYLTKPFSPKELIARIRAILRRLNIQSIKANVLEFGGELKINIDNMEVYKGNKLIDLTLTEFRILALLANHPGKVFSREDLVTKILGYDYEGYDRTIDTHIKNIRQKIEEKEKKYIVTVYGAGYKFMGE